MRVPEPRSVDPLTQRGRLRQFLKWITPIIFGFALLEGAAFIMFGDKPSALSGIIIFCFGGALLFASLHIGQGHLRRAATIIWAGLLSAASLIVLVQPGLFPTLVVIPLLVVVVALPYARGRDLQRLIVVCWLVTIFVSIAGVLLPRYSTLPAWFVLMFGTSSLAAAVAMTLLLLWQFSSRLTETLAQTQAANHALRAVHTALEAQHEYLAVTLHSIGDGVITTDINGRIRSLNRAAEMMTGWTQAEAVGTSFATICHLVHEQTQTRIENPVEALVQHGRFFESGNQALIIARDGTTRSVATSAALLRGHERESIGLVLAFHDITAYKQATDERIALERKLQETQKLESLGVLAGGIAHDFNNLLTAILGHASLALADVAPDDLAYPSIVQIEQGARQAAKLTEQLLAYAGKGRFVVEPLNLNTVIGEMITLLHTSISKRVQLHTQFLPALPSVTADATQIRQVVMNLVINASEAIGEHDGDVFLKTWVEPAGSASSSSPGNYVALAVTDTGMGMDALTQAKIFEPFYTTKFTGRGLGLAAVQGIVRSHQGLIDVASVAGQGTTITVLLPVTDERTPSEEPAPVPPDMALAQETAQPAGQPTVVLVVDDEANVRAVTTRMLHHLGYQVLTAVDGSNAVALFINHSPELCCVLLDMTMPRMDGLATLHVCQQIAPHIPVVLMSGYTVEEVNRRFAGQSFAGFLHKPFTLAALRTVLTSVVVQATP